jgi:hypothetical protein
VNDLSEEWPRIEQGVRLRKGLELLRGTLHSLGQTVEELEGGLNRQERLLGGVTSGHASINGGKDAKDPISSCGRFEKRSVSDGEQRFLSFINAADPCLCRDFDKANAYEFSGCDNPLNVNTLIGAHAAIP